MLSIISSLPEKFNWDKISHPLNSDPEFNSRSSFVNIKRELRPLVTQVDGSVFEGEWDIKSNIKNGKGV